MAIQASLIDKQEHIEQAARALKSISHPLRLKILCVVGDQEACVQEIVDAVGTSQSNISQHPVSYTHLDVYKRQLYASASR